MKSRDVGIVCVLGVMLSVCLAGHAASPVGEGTARLIPTGNMVAGSAVSFEIEFTVGPSGIAVGGGILINVHHAAMWPTPQFEHPKSPDFVTVQTPADNLELSRIARQNRFKSPNKFDRIHNKGVHATVTNVPLEPGEVVRFRFGASPAGTRVPRSADRVAQHRVMVDVDGSGVFLGIAESPTYDIVAGPVAQLFVTAPSVAVVGEVVDIVIRAEDQYWNRTTDLDAGVTLSGLPQTKTQIIELVGGIARVELPVKEAGVIRARVEVMAGDGISAEAAAGLVAESNPVVVAARSPEYRIYWGDIHGHTNLSDGLGESPEEYFAFGRDEADLDVCALAEHGWSSLEEVRRAVKAFHDPGRYVTILGHEWGASHPDAGDKNVYFRSDDEVAFSGWPHSAEELFETLEAAYGDNTDRRIIVGPHHFTYNSSKGGRPFKTWDARFERFVEVYSAHGMSEYHGNPRMLHGADPKRFMVEGLAAGHRFGVISSSDNHDSRPGRNSWGQHHGGVAAFVAEELTREAIWDAFWNRRVYASTTARIYIDLHIDGHLMGEEFTAVGPPSIEYTVHGCDDEMEVFLLKNNQELRVTASETGTVKEAFEDTDFDGDSFYYLRVVQADGEWAWSSPIWVNAASE